MAGLPHHTLDAVIGGGWGPACDVSHYSMHVHAHTLDAARP